jgi:uncharacterized membrane protein
MDGSTAITINKPIDEVYGYWQDFERLPSFMWHLKSVKVSGGGRSHWVANGPAGTTVEWDAETVEDVPNERISWRSLEGADVANAGTVTFTPAPGNRGTEVRVELSYNPPGGPVGAVVAKLFGEEPEQQLKDDLRRFKQVLETGEVVVSNAAPEGTRTQRQMKQEEAQP